MNKFKILIYTILLSSCSNFFSGGFTLNSANYSLDYLTFNKKLDYNNKTYLLNETNFNNSKLANGSNLEQVTSFFKNKLKNNVTLKTKFRDADGKYVLPFHLQYEISKEQLQLLSKQTDFDYIILSKISYLEFLNRDSLPNNRLRLTNTKAGAISSIKIIDIKKKEVFLEMSCTGDVYIRDNVNMYTGIREFQPIPIHKDSYSLGEKSMKKLLKKIK